ncbi:MAG: histidine utilization repressor [Xanthobacteraceae bacterium]|nr:histidine utilization repressor [Xanthobacteraceae bacterium]PWB61356.1 MAG: histidine utilization repressor [Bradyrhizobiaceae bacterium]
MTRPIALPRYAEIQRALERAILSGEWPPGHRVPSEQELTRRYGCSRMTVNRALTALAAAGLIVRRRRSGSFVATPSSEETVLEIHDIEADVRRSGKAYRFQLRSRRERRATRTDAARLAVTAGTPVLALECLHLAAGQPLVLEDRLINLAAVEAARDADFAQKPPGSWLLAQIPWSEAEHQISAANADIATAKALGIAPGAACLLVRRRTFQAGSPLTQVVLTYPGDRHHLVARFSPAGSVQAS